jgi:hypothetical protein
MQLKALLFAILPMVASAFQRGDVISYELMETNTLSDMQSQLEAQGLPPDLYGCRYGVKIYRVLYQTITPLGDSTAASGAVAIPIGDLCRMPLANYSHGTVLDKEGVPSFLSYEAQIGRLFACRGIVVSMPDYLGLGLGTGLHPYVHAKSEASATIDMLRAIRLLQADLSFALNDQLFLLGYSQGGHACMATHREIDLFHSAEFTVTASAPMSGPYDISGVQSQYLIDDVPYSSPAYLPYVIYSYKEYYPALFDTVQYIFAPPYDVTLPPYFDGTHSFGNANAVCAPIPNDMILPAVFDEFLSMPDHPFWVALRDNDVYDWVPQAPIRMYYCMGDEQVHYMNALVADSAFNALGAPDVEAVGLSTTEDHAGCVPLALLSGNSFFSEFMELGNGMELSALITQGAGGQNTFDVALSVTGSEGPYTYAWEFGDDSPIVTNLGSGQYVVSVTDATGCTLTQNLNVTAPNGLDEHSDARLFLLPNPASDHVMLSTSVQGPLSYSIVDMMGRQVQKGNLYAVRILDISTLLPGIYTVRTTQAGRAQTLRLVKE